MDKIKLAYYYYIVSMAEIIVLKSLGTGCSNDFARGPN